MSRVLTVRALLTPSHETLAEDWFLRTLPGDCRPELHRVEAEPVDFATRHWHRVVVKKFDVLDRAIEIEAPGSIFVMSDVDIRFYHSFADDVRQRIQGLDVLFQDNRPGRPQQPGNLCSGFMVVRASERTRAFFQRAHAILRAADRPNLGDQKACIEALREQPDRIRFALLPPTYWVPYTEDGVHWKPGEPLDPPEHIVLHHANWTIGVANKLAQLEAVERQLAPSRFAG
jgi:hypothetical protein